MDMPAQLTATVYGDESKDILVSFMFIFLYLYFLKYYSWNIFCFCLRKYTEDIYTSPRVSLVVNVRTFKAEVLETMYVYYMVSKRRQFRRKRTQRRRFLLQLALS